MTPAGRKKALGLRYRVHIVLGVMLFALGGLMSQFYIVQVANVDKHLSRLDKQSTRRVRLPGMRGRIFTRDGELLADNRPSYCIAIYLEELRLTNRTRHLVDQVMDRIGELGRVLGRESLVNEQSIRLHRQKRRPLPIIAWKDLSEEDLARFAEQASQVPGVDLYVDVVRVYPLGNTASHLIGYVGLTNMVQDAGQPYHYHSKEMIGRRGVEKRMDGVLRGRAGGRLMRIDVSGFRHEDIAEQRPSSGSEIRLAIDLKAQQLVEESLDGVEGAAVIMDPNNGDVLAIASSPSFDPNAFVPSLSHQAADTLYNHTGHPLVNRAAMGYYTPGSIFKPVVALAALSADPSMADSRVHCPGYYKLGNGRIQCWLSGGHGEIAMEEAISYSCNTFFCAISRRVGHEKIVDMARDLGLGNATGIHLSSESLGLLPNAAWKREAHNEGWFEGDTCNLSIGQGPITVTPLQAALMMSAIANKGTLYRPRLILGIRLPDQPGDRLFPVQVTGRLRCPPPAFETLSQGLYNVVMSDRGTGRKARVPGITMAGKTGTAEFGPESLKKKRGWMIAYAPFESPRFVVSVVVDEAQGGGIDAAPRVRRIMAGLFGVELPDEEGERG